MARTERINEYLARSQGASYDQIQDSPIQNMNESPISLKKEDQILNVADSNQEPTSQPDLSSIQKDVNALNGMSDYENFYQDFSMNKQKLGQSQNMNGQVELMRDNNNDDDASPVPDEKILASVQGTQDERRMSSESLDTEKITRGSARRYLNCQQQSREVLQVTEVPLKQSLQMYETKKSSGAPLHDETTGSGQYNSSQRSPETSLKV